MSIKGRMDKEDVVHVYNGILLSHKIEPQNKPMVTKGEMNERDKLGDWD